MSTRSVSRCTRCGVMVQACWSAEHAPAVPIGSRNSCGSSGVGRSSGTPRTRIGRGRRHPHPLLHAITPTGLTESKESGVIHSDRHTRPRRARMSVRVWGIRTSAFASRCLRDGHRPICGDAAQEDRAMSTTSMASSPGEVRLGQRANCWGRGVAGLLLPSLRRIEHARSGSDLVGRRHNHFLSRSRSKADRRSCIQVTL